MHDNDAGLLLDRPREKRETIIILFCMACDRCPQIDP